MLQQLANFFNENSLIFLFLSVIIIVVIFAAMGIMFSQLRRQIRKLTGEIEDKKLWEQFFFDVKDVKHFPTFIAKYQSVAKKAAYPSGDFWKEKLQEVVDRYISEQVEFYLNTFRADGSLTDPVHVLLLVKEMEELICIGKELASPRMQVLMKEELNIPINTALGVLKNSDKEAYEIAQKIKYFIYPETAPPKPSKSYNEPVWFMN